MGKVSIGLRGWRFDESEVFGPDGEFRPFDEMDRDVRERLVRLSAVVGSPCDACWLVHGDEHVEECNVAGYVYGEPLAEVLVCEAHEPDFVYWFREAGGADHAGAEDFDDRFHEWFLDGGRAPEGYEGMDYVDEAPADLPDPPTDADPDLEAGEVTERIDIREGTVEEFDVDPDYPTS